jgi:hypothetical protein
MDGMFRWAMLLHAGVFALVLPMYAVEYSAIRNSKFFGDAIWRGLPKWAVRAIQIGGLFFAAHFVLFLVQSHAASPEIVNGAYVLSDHGRIVKELTESQYRWLKGDELRLFATGGLSFYLALAFYWWFPRRAATKGVTAEPFQSGDSAQTTSLPFSSQLQTRCNDECAKDNPRSEMQTPPKPSVRGQRRRTSYAPSEKDVGCPRTQEKGNRIPEHLGRFHAVVGC